MSMTSGTPHDLAGRRFAGRFCDGPFVGLKYSTASGHGSVGFDGVFWYLPGEVVTFQIGSLTVGSAVGAPVISVADLAGQPSGASLRAPQITNRAVLLQSLTQERAVIDEAAAGLDAEAAGSIDFDLDEATFARRVAKSNGRGLRLRSASEARNRLRRALAGIEFRRDVAIPVRDGVSLSADVFLPTRAQGPVPALLALGIYGKAFGLGSAVTPEQVLESEVREDEWFEGDRSSLPWITRYTENLNAANAFDWVPRGYAMVRIDGRGIGKSPGTVSPWSRQEAEDYYDSIQWVAEQPWCDGNVGLLGASYKSINQWAVAAMKPPALRAMIPYATDQDLYRDLVCAGGIFDRVFWEDWWPTMVLPARPLGEGPTVDFLAALAQHPFDDEWWSSSEADPFLGRLEDIDIPVMPVVAMMLVVHGRGGFEAFRRLGGEKYLRVVDAAYASYQTADTLQDQVDFFDKHIKGRSKELAPVRFLIRKGGDEIEWRESASWPPPETEYIYLHLDAAAGVATRSEPATDAWLEYSADPVAEGVPRGASFLSEPLPTELLIAGHLTAQVALSSSTSDADVFVSLRAFDGDNEVRFSTREPSDAPISSGFLRASHRAIDELKSTTERPWHTHTEEDYAPLTPGEPVEVLVELLPATALVRAGWRLRVDVSATGGVEGYQVLGRAYDPYHTGATNTVYTGNSRSSWLRLPLLSLD